jgi:hypothetical protein
LCDMTVRIKIFLSVRLFHWSSNVSILMKEWEWVDERVSSDGDFFNFFVSYGW